MIKKSDVEEQKYTLVEVVLGIVIVGVILGVITLFTERKVYNLLGSIYGSGIAIVLSVHMWITVNRAFELIADDVSRYITKNYVMRMCIAAFLMLVIIYLNFGNYLFAMAGIFSLKVSAYLQPLTHKLLKCIAKGE